MDISKAKRVVQVSSHISSPCVVCREHLRPDDGDFHKVINHYIEQHGFRLLHVGQETHTGITVDVYQTTVAVLGEF